MELFEEANRLHLEGKYAEAEPMYDGLLTQNHDNPGLLATMGTLQLHTHKPGLAMVLLHAAVDQMRAKKMQVPSDILSNLGLSYKYSGLTEKALKYMKQAIDAEPTAASLAVYGAMFVEADAKKCIDYSSRAIKKDPKLALAHWNMSIALLEDGQWETGWDEYEWGFKAKVRVDREPKDKPRWDGKAPGTVCVYGEQGIGDEIMFASMLPDVLKTNAVIFECHKRLKTLFEHSFPIVCHGTREDKEVTWEDDFDYQISIGSLGEFYRRSRESFPGTPYLKADALPRGEKFRVGISWTGGGQKQGRVQTRTVPLPWWRSILMNDCEFVSLQYTPNASEQITAVNSLGYDIKEAPEATADDYYETARLVKSCDLVISVCTSVVHLAGALGVPCWVATPAHPAWRYGSSGPMMWYRSVRLYRQPKDDWKPVIQRMGLDLDELLHPGKAAYG